MPNPDHPARSNRTAARLCAAVCAAARLVPMGVLLIVLAGCSGDESSAPAQNAKKSNLRLNLLVVDDEALVEAIRPLKAEWQARSGAGFEVRSATSAELAEMKTVSDDAIIFPSARLGWLVERGMIAPLPAEKLKGDELGWSDLFEVLQLREVMWNGQPHAVPFGSPLLVCWYRPDLFEKFKRQPPVTWTEYQQAAEFFAQRDKLKDAAPAADVPWSGTLEPRAPGWAGSLLLARAAAYAKHRDSYSTFFNIDSMEPLIAGPPYVRRADRTGRGRASASRQRRGARPDGRQARISGRSRSHGAHLAHGGPAQDSRADHDAGRFCRTSWRRKGL